MRDISCHVHMNACRQYTSLWLRRCRWEVGGSVPICSSLCAKIVKPELLSDVFIEVLMLEKKCLYEWVTEARKVLELKSAK